MKIVRLAESDIRAVFEAAKSQSDYIHGIYRLVFPNLDNISFVDGIPRCSRELSYTIYNLAIAWDRKHALETGQIRGGQPTFFPGGAWMNWGFGVSEALAGFNVETCPVALKQPALLSA